MPEINVPKEFKEFKICGWINFDDGTSELVIRYYKFNMFNERFITINGNEYVRELVEQPNIHRYFDNSPYQTIKLPEESWKVRHDTMLNAWYNVTNVKDYIIVKNEEEKSGFSSVVNFNIAKHIIEDAIKIWGLNVKNICAEEEITSLKEENIKLKKEKEEIKSRYDGLNYMLEDFVRRMEAKKNE